VAPFGECYSAPRNVLVPSEDRALCKDAGVMATSGPSWNTDQGVAQRRECAGDKPLRVVKANAGGSPHGRTTDRS